MLTLWCSSLPPHTRPPAPGGAPPPPPPPRAPLAPAPPQDPRPRGGVVGAAAPLAGALQRSQHGLAPAGGGEGGALLRPAVEEEAPLEQRGRARELPVAHPLLAGAGGARLPPPPPRGGPRPRPPPPPPRPPGAPPPGPAHPPPPAPPAR